MRTNGSAWKVTVSFPDGFLPYWSKPPHVQVAGCARKQSNSTGIDVADPASAPLVSRVHRITHVCASMSSRSTSRAAARVKKSGAVIRIGRVMVRLEDRYPNGRSPSRSSCATMSVAGCGADRS